MPLASPLRRAMGAALLAGLVALAGPASILASQPTPGYTPAFVTEREAGPWEDCIWAAAAMLLDKWTSGARATDRERLRQLSGDREGGSNLGNVKRAFSRLGVDLTFSPGGGASISWSRLLDRLAHGGGAILLGDYHELPARYGRWDPDFWRRTGTGDDHALYLDRYDRRTGRILVMDPLAPAGWHGEWVPVKALKRFAWRTGGGALWAAMTPAARVVPPFENVTLGSPSAWADGSGVHVAWRVEAAPPDWALRGGSLSTQLEAVGEIDPALPALQAPGPGVAPAAGPGISPGDGLLEAGIPVPQAAGLFRLSVGLSDPMTGRVVGVGGPYSLYVPGPRAGSITVPSRAVLTAGALATFPVAVTNTGTESWADPPLVAWLPIEDQQAPEVRLVGRWVRPATTAPASTPGPATGPAPGAAAGPFLAAAPAGLAHGDAAFQARLTGKLDLGPLHLEIGDQTTIVAQAQAPATPGPWWLVFELVDEHERSLALSGSAPGIVSVEVLAAAGTPLPG